MTHLKVELTLEPCCNIDILQSIIDKYAVHTTDSMRTDIPGLGDDVHLGDILIAQVAALKVSRGKSFPSLGKMFRAFMTCSRDLQEHACNMIEMIENQESSDEARQAAADTLDDILFPP